MPGRHDELVPLSGNGERGVGGHRLRRPGKRRREDRRVGDDSVGEGAGRRELATAGEEEGGMESRRRPQLALDREEEEGGVRGCRVA